MEVFVKVMIGVIGAAAVLWIWMTVRSLIVLHSLQQELKTLHDELMKDLKNK